MNFKERFISLYKKKYGNLHKMYVENKDKLTYCQIYQYAHGRIPEFKNAIKLCKIFDCNLNYLYGFSNKKGRFIYNKEEK